MDHLPGTNITLKEAARLFLILILIPWTLGGIAVWLALRAGMIETVPNLYAWGVIFLAATGVATGIVQAVADGRTWLGRPQQDDIPPPAPLLRPIPHTLPAAAPDFTGRADLLADLLTALDPTTAVDHPVAHITGIRGMGGVGKTELALQIAHRLLQKDPARFSGGRLFLSLQPGDRPLAPLDVLGRLLSALHPEAKLPDSVDERQALYRQALHNTQGLLILDNAASAAQIQPLLPPPAGWTFLVTSRHHFPLPSARPVNLDVLDPADALALLVRLLSDGDRPALAQDRPALAAIAQLCGHLPLALRLAAAFLVTAPDWSGADYQTALAQRRLAYLKQDGAPDLAAVLTLSVDSLAADHPELVQPWRELAVFPAPFDREAVAAVWATDPAPTRDGLTYLLRRSLLDFDPATQTYRLHDLLAELIRDTTPAPDLDPARLRHARHYLALGRAADDQYEAGHHHILPALAAWDTLWPHLAAAWDHLSPRTDPDALNWLSDFAGPDSLLSLRLPPVQQIPYFTAAASAAHTLGDRRNEGVWLGNLGTAYAALGQVERAIEHHTQALAISREIGDRRNEGAWLGNLGTAYAALGQVERAIEHHTQALDISREIGDRRNEDAWMGKWGLTYTDLGQVERAIAHSTDVLAISREIGDRRGEGACLGNLGNAYYSLGQVERAIEYHTQALAISREIGDRRGEGADLGNLGSAYFFLGQVERAIEHYTQALAISREIGDRRMEGSVLGNLGRLYADLERPADALSLCTESLHIKQETGDPLGQGEALGYMAYAHLRADHPHQARPLQEQALPLLRQVKNPWSLCELLNDYTETLLALDDLPAAHVAATEVRTLAEPVGYRPHLAPALSNLGTIAHRQGDDSAARRLWQQALEIFDEIRSPQAAIVHTLLTTPPTP